MKIKTIPCRGFGHFAMLLTLFGVLFISGCEKTTKKESEASTVAPAVEEEPVEAPAAVPSRVEEAKVIMGGMMAALEKMTVAFEGVKDEETAKTAAAEITATTAEVAELVEKARTLKEEMSEEEQKELETSQEGPEIEAKMKAIMERLSKAGAALPQDPAVQEAIMPAVKSFGETMRAMSGY